MFDTYYFGLAFLDGGWAKRVPYGLSGPIREWMVGVDAMALLCHRLRVGLPRRGRFASAPSDEELEARWDIQRRDDTDLRARSDLLAEAGARPQLEELAFRLRPPDPRPRPRKRPIFMISTEDKSKDQIADEAWQAYQKYLLEKARDQEKAANNSRRAEAT